VKHFIYKGLGFELFLELEGKKAHVTAQGPLSRLARPICEGFNTYASLEKVTAVRGNDVVISSLIPPAPSGPFNRLIKAQINNRLFGKYTPESLMILTTSKCQCTCQHCIAFGIRGDPELSTEELCNAIDQSIELGTYNVSFEGGEPTLRKDIFDLISHIDKNKATSHLITNGFLLTQAYVKKLKEAGLDYLHLSLDSPYPNIHDKFRGINGIFEKVASDVKYAVEEGLVVIIEYTAAPGNSDIKALNDLYQYCSSIGVQEILIDEVVPAGRWAYRENDVLKEEDRARLVKFQNEANELEGSRVCGSLILRDPKIIGCFAGRKWMWLSPTGEVMPCFHVPISFGNTRNQSMKDIWKAMRKHPLFKKAPKNCAWADPYYKQHYFKKIQDSINEKNLPYPISKLDGRKD